uniref:Uncharacterized protein n=1 Tax=Oryza glaberrima TaxID=4538 RepID=I1P2N9_ORYGL
TTGASKTSSWTTGDLLFSPVTRAADLAAWRLGAADLAAWSSGCVDRAVHLKDLA